MLARMLIVWSLVLLPGPATAAGFALDYEGARALGFATAGGASAEDATTIFYNPAGMAYLSRDQFIAGGQLLILHDNFVDEGSTILGGALATPGANGEQAFPTTPIPWLFATRHIADDLTIGLGLYAPFGLKDDYGSQFVGRYQSREASLAVVNLNPSIAYRPLPWLSAAGANIEYARLQLKQAIDFGSFCTVTLGTGLCSAAFGLIPGQSDGQGKLTASGFASGYNFGILVEPEAGTRFGAAYRSGTSYRFGNAKQEFFVPAGARAFLVAGGMPLAFTGGAASVGLPLPGRLPLR
jgi:long-chain fatty acid transport protein